MDFSNTDSIEDIEEDNKILRACAIENMVSIYICDNFEKIQK